MESLSVVGIGKLGLCISLILEKIGFKVFGIDVDSKYVELLNNKKFKSTEPKVNDYLKSSSNFLATTDSKVVLNSDIIFIYVDTPSLPNGRYDHSRIDQVVDELLKLGSQKSKKHIIIGCTVMPGYCDLLKNKVHKLGYIVSYNPEFIAQGSIINDLLNPDLILIGEGDKYVGKYLEKIYSLFVQNKPTIHKVSPKEAEISKIALNCFLTTKIAYANMIGDIANLAGCNPDVILGVVGSDSRIGEKNLKYGYGFGGPCLPRDNRALKIYAKDIGVDANISAATDKANKLHLEYQIENFVKNNNKEKQIIFSDICYKTNTNIIEESQKLALAVSLAKKGYKILIKDRKEVVKKIKSVYGDLFDY